MSFVRVIFEESESNHFNHHCLMLFVLGLSVGYNPLIVKNLGSFGGQALLLSVAGITGSVLLARLVYLWFFKEGGEK